MASKTKYFITTMRHGTNCLLQLSDLMYKFNPTSQAWEISDYWFDAVVMGDFTSYEEIDEKRAKLIVANEGVF
jgi:hypothetical protein